MSKLPNFELFYLCRESQTKFQVVFRVVFQAKFFFYWIASLGDVHVGDDGGERAEPGEEVHVDDVLERHPVPARRDDVELRAIVLDIG